MPRGRAPNVLRRTGQGSLELIRTRPEVPPRDPEAGPQRFWGRDRSGLTLKDPGVPQGRAPKVIRRTGQGSLEFIRTRPEVLPRGPREGTPRQDPTFRGPGQVGVESIDLRVPRGKALKVPRRIGWGSLECDQAYWIP